MRAGDFKSNIMHLIFWWQYLGEIFLLRAVILSGLGPISL